MTEYPLTEEQRKLAEKNHNLIFGFAKSRKIDLREFYDLLAIGLCKAAKNYDPQEGYQFSTIAYKSMENEWISHLRTELRPSHIPDDLIISYNAEMRKEDGKRTQFLDYIADHLGCADEECLVFIRAFINRLPELDRKIIRMLLFGYSAREIAHSLLISEKTVYNTKRKIRRRWNRFNGKTNNEKYYK